MVCERTVKIVIVNCFSHSHIRTTVLHQELVTKTFWRHRSLSTVVDCKLHGTHMFLIMCHIAFVILW